VNVGERMSRDTLTTERGATLREAAQRMVERHVGSILVMDGDRLVGVLTERDVLRVFAQGDFETSVADAMTTNPETLEPDESLETARRVMLHGGFRHLPVCEAQRLVGVLSIRDLLAPEGDEAPRGV
jgi:CBS domain-containing protein